MFSVRRPCASVRGRGGWGDWIAQAGGGDVIARRGRNDSGPGWAPRYGVCAPICQPRAPAQSCSDSQPLSTLFFFSFFRAHRVPGGVPDARTGRDRSRAHARGERRSARRLRGLGDAPDSERDAAGVEAGGVDEGGHVEVRKRRADGQLSVWGLLGGMIGTAG